MSQIITNDHRPPSAHEGSGVLPLRSPTQDTDPQLRNLAASPPPVPSPYPYNDRAQTQLQPIQPSQSPYHNTSYYPAQYQAPYPPQQAHYGLGNSPNGQTSPAPPTTGAPNGEAQKRSRLARACDQCSERKVKCDAFGPPCKPCKDLGLPCTNNRETKRRGPRNRLAEQYHQSKKQKPEEGDHALISPADRRESAEALAYMSSQGRRPEYNQTAYSNPYGYNGYSQSISSGSRPSIDRLLCPKVILDLLVDDFFTYIHPVTPYPHEPSFRSAYRDQLYLDDPSFLALLASMIGTLVASFPRKPQQHLKAQNMQGEFAKSLDFVRRCHVTATEARGTGFLDKNLTINDAATSYFLGLAAAYTFEWRSRLYFAETLNILRNLGVHRPFEPIHSGFTEQNSDSTSIDFIGQQLGRRLFWAMLVGIRSIQQLGTTFGELFFPPPTPTDPYPPLPEDIDDEYIFVDRIERQPEGVLSKMAGFNINVKIYSSLTKIATMEIVYGVDQVYEWNRQKEILNECYENVEHALDHIPAELVLRPGSSVGNFASTQPSMANYPSDLNGTDLTEFMSRREIQFEIQKANIYASQLGTRSYIVEKFWNLQDAYNKAQSTSTSPLNHGYSDGHTSSYPHAQVRRKRLEDRVAQERENIVKELLKVLCSISRVNMEPNGGSFVNKVRQVASTLIVTNDTRKGPVAHQAQEFLGRLLDVLVALERSGPTPRTSNDLDAPRKQVLSEEEELAIWADLREVQMAFLARGGFFSSS